MDGAMIEEVKDQIIELIGCKQEDILHASGRTGLGVEAILDAIVEQDTCARKANRMHRCRH